MTGNDLRYIRMLLDAGIVRGSCLECGAGIPEHSLQPLLAARGLEWIGTDIESHNESVICLDLEASFETIDREVEGRRFDTVFLMSVLEHTFDPIRVLDNTYRLTAAGGHCVVVVPTVWPLHYFPIDCWRVSPQFFAEYARRRGYRLLDEFSYYVDPFMQRVVLGNGGQPDLPRPALGLRYWRSRIVHRLFDTYGRENTVPGTVSTGVVLTRDVAS